MTKEEVGGKLDSIIEYSELEQFIDSPISAYSTGMVARLGFSVLAHMQPDILLLDEILSVGDAAFQQKCEATMHDFFSAGVTMLVVSHQISTIRSLCHEAVWIEKGTLRAVGDVTEVTNLYEQHIEQSTNHQ